MSDGGLYEDKKQITLFLGKQEHRKKKEEKKNQMKEEIYMGFFTSAINILQTLVVAIGAGLGVWGVINLMEGYGNDNLATRS